MNTTSDSSTVRQTAGRLFTARLRNALRRRGRKHDPFLVLSLAKFNSGQGSHELFRPLKVREVVG